MTPSAGQAEAHEVLFDKRVKILFMVDELKAGGLARRTQALIGKLAAWADLVLVAQCYLKPSHRVRRLDVRHEFYGFAAATYETGVAAFAASLSARHQPECAVLYGWENAQLVVELERLDVPVVTYTETRAEAPNAESQLNRTLRHATEVFFSDPSIPTTLTQALWGLESRHYGVLRDVPPAPLVRSGMDVSGAIRRLFGGETPAASFSLIEVDEVGKALEQACRRAVTRCARRLRHARSDAVLIEAEGGLNPDLALRRGEEDRDPVATYLRASELTQPRARVTAGRLLRRPIAGFHPLIYATDQPAFDEAQGEDPLAHYLRNGRPQGRWTHEVLRPDATIAAPMDIAAAVHAHLHYPELLPDLLERLGENAAKVDLIVTTTSQASRELIAASLAKAGVATTTLRICENRGRDLWPFLALLQDGAFDGYEAVGHFHGKRSPHFDAGQIWRDFLWTHLVGPPRMLDTILARFAADSRLGLVFAEEPHLEGWEKNLEMASAIAARAQLPQPLPLHFEYPMGTMFWVRPAALSPLRRLGLTHDDIPPEPLAIDGTLLHALERLIPFFVAAAGFAYATSHVPGSKR